MNGWIVAVQIAAPFVAAGVAVFGVLRTIRQKDLSDRRSEWWRRVTWALERTDSPDDAIAQTGWILLSDLLDSDLATDSEAAIVERLAELTAETDNELTEEGDADDQP